MSGVANRSQRTEEKIRSAEQVDVWVTAQRWSERTLGYTCGAFDLLHAGHVDYLEAARGYCDRLLVAVNSDAAIRSYKSPLRPVNSEQERMRVVAALAATDCVTLLDEERPLNQLLRWRPDVYFKGGDYSEARLRSAGAVREYGGRVVLIPVEYAASTSRILRKAASLALHAPPEPAVKPSRIVFLDRDGTLIRDYPYLHDPSAVELLPGVGEGLAQLQQAGFALVLVTNQQGIGLGYYSFDEFAAVNRALFRKLRPYGVKIARVYFCPHSLADECRCRKPSSLLLERAFEHFGVPPECCWFIGDQRCDVEAAQSAGCRAVRIGDDDVPDFAGAVKRILEEERGDAGC